MNKAAIVMLLGDGPTRVAPARDRRSAALKECDELLFRDARVADFGLEERLVGRSPAMARLRSEIATISDVGADVLVLGETGAGKDVVARALHEGSARREGPFVALNCGAMPAEMVESELFGHEQGAFTGASRTRIGKLEYASGGTVFLDEIESMPLALQVKLLRVIEGRSIERLGANKSIQLDLRFVAATKLDLKQEADAGRFRKDLYYRLNVVSLRIPPLRDRKEDLALLFHTLARQAGSRYRRAVPAIPDMLLGQLHAWDWPGNVRELRNVADRFVLGLPLGIEGTTAPAPYAARETSLADQIGQHERALILAEIERNNGNITATAEALGVSRKSLYDKLRKYGVKRRQ